MCAGLGARPGALRQTTQIPGLGDSEFAEENSNPADAQAMMIKVDFD